MFRATIMSIFRSVKLCNTARSMLHPIRGRSVIWWGRNWLSSSVTTSPTDHVLGTTYHKLYCTV